jgi:serine protease AprX
MVERDEHGAEDTVVFGIRWDGGRRPRNGRKWLTAAIAVVTAALLPTAAAQAASSHGRELRALVVPAAGHDGDARRLVARLGGHAGRRIGIVDGFAARVPAHAVARLASARVIRSATPDVSLSVRSAGDDAAATAATSMDMVRSASGSQPLQDRGIDGSGVGVALVDSGAMRLPGLDDGQLVTGPDFSGDADDRDLRGLDAFGHGTHLAGIIAGRDGAWSGVAPGARVVSVKVADASGSTNLLRVLEGLDWVRSHRSELDIRVVNLSLGVGVGNAGYVREPLAFAVEQLWRSGLVVVAAAGNGGNASGQLDLPAADPYVVAVGGADTADTAARDDDSVASFSSRGGARSPDVVAPATRIVSLRVPGSTLDHAFPAARIGDRWFRGSGTSQAAAVVSGLAAQLLQQRPWLSPDQVKALLVSGAVPVGGDTKSAEGAGEVDAAASGAQPAPSASSAAQRFPLAVLDLRRLRSVGSHRHSAIGDDRWAGSTWSGSTWSGSTWSGSTWSGSTWSGSTWSAASWGDDGGS